MNSTITMTQLKNKIETPSDGRKVAKLFQDKVNVMSDEYYNQMLSRIDNTVSSITNRIVDMFNLTYSSVAVDESDKLVSARKLKINNPTNLFDNSLEEYNKSVKDEVEIKRSSKQVNTPVVDNVVPFPSMRREQNVVSENNQSFTNNVVDFPTERVVNRNELNTNIGTNTLANTGVNNDMSDTNVNTLSRISRMDYNSIPKTDVSIRENNVSIDDYLQHGKVKNSDRDLKVLMENNERLSSEIDESQKVLEQLEAQLAKLKEISEARRQARINELEEENLSKTATLNGLTEQIRALQEAIRLEQQNANEGSMRRVA